MIKQRKCERERERERERESFRRRWRSNNILPEREREHGDLYGQSYKHVKALELYLFLIYCRVQC